MARQKLKVLSAEQIFSFHELLIQRDGGLPGLCSKASLSSVIQRVYNHAQYDTTFRDPWRLSGLLTYAILIGHPFNDGNKRTALVAGVSMLALNKCGQPAPMASAELLVAATAGEVDQEQFLDQFAALAKETR
ncbi:MAG: type II toxin-antitoxin system death-on-curing family toxin [Pseudomonadota bacterium]